AGARGSAIAVVFASGIRREVADRNADLAVTELARSATVREQHVVDRSQRAAEILLARRVESVCVAEDSVYPRLVDRAPALDAVAVGVEARARVLGERVDDVGVAPAAVVLERLRQIPVVKRDERLDVLLVE